MNKTNKYFWPHDVPLNADIERHRDEEKKLDEKIAIIEAKPEKDAMDESCLRTYRHLRAQLLVSKSKVVEKLGKKTK